MAICTLLLVGSKDRHALRSFQFHQDEGWQPDADQVDANDLRNPRKKRPRLPGDRLILG